MVSGARRLGERGWVILAQVTCVLQSVGGAGKVAVGAGQVRRQRAHPGSSLRVSGPLQVPVCASCAASPGARSGGLHGALCPDARVCVPRSQAARSSLHDSLSGGTAHHVCGGTGLLRFPGRKQGPPLPKARAQLVPLGGGPVGARCVVL